MRMLATIVMLSFAIGGTAAAANPAYQRQLAERRAEVQREQAERRAAVQARQAAWQASRKSGSQRGEAQPAESSAFEERRSPQEIWVAEQFRQRVTHRPPNAHPRWADQPEWSGANRGPSPFGRPSTAYNR